MNIAQGLAHSKKISGTRQAVACGETRYTWEELDQRTDALARGLASLGVVRGDRVAVLMLNCHRYLELYYACARMGAVIVPLNIRLARQEIVFILNDSESKVLVADKTFAPYATGRDTFPTVESIVYCGNETPEGMINYDDVVSKGSHMQESVDQEMEDDDLAGLFDFPTRHCFQRRIHSGSAALVGGVPLRSTRRGHFCTNCRSHRRSGYASWCWPLCPSRS